MKGYARDPKYRATRNSIFAAISIGFFMANPIIGEAQSLCVECHEVTVWAGTEVTYYHTFDQPQGGGMDLAGVFRQCGGIAELQSEGEPHGNCHKSMVEGDCGTHDLCGGGALAAAVSAVVADLRSHDWAPQGVDTLADLVLSRAEVDLLETEGILRVLDCEGNVMLMEQLEVRVVRAISHLMRERSSQAVA